jgi:alanine racemase
VTIRPAWAEVSVSAIRGNTELFAGLVGPSASVCAVVKAGAYGHGSVAASKAALAGGATMLAVALAEEGLELRAAGIAAPILVFGEPRPEEMAAILEAGLEATVFDEATILAFDAAARTSGTKARLHLKIDSGMGRIGCPPASAPTLAALVSRLPGTELAGVYSHFVDADAPDLAFAREQLRLFLGAVDAIQATGIAIPLRHIANSAATLWFPEARLDMVRLGIALYGLRPEATRDFPLAGIRPALSVKARVTRVATLEKGATVSYGRTWTADRTSRIATLPLGYADGYPRLVSGRIWAGFSGRRLPQVGRICMDMCMFDVTDAPDVVEGSELILLGPGGPSLEEVATSAGTINYEIACHASLRLPRRLVEEQS